MRVAPAKLLGVRRYVAPALLVLVAVLQVVRAHTHDQSSWSGGGFGMFATYENEDSRFVRTWAITAGGEEAVGLPAGLDREALEVRVVPTSARLRALAREVAERLGDEVMAVRVEVWGIRLDHPDAELDAFRIEHGTYQR